MTKFSTSPQVCTQQQQQGLHLARFSDLSNTSSSSSITSTASNAPVSTPPLHIQRFLKHKFGGIRHKLCNPFHGSLRAKGPPNELQELLEDYCGFMMKFFEEHDIADLEDLEVHCMDHSLPTLDDYADASGEDNYSSGDDAGDSMDTTDLEDSPQMSQM